MTTQCRVLITGGSIGIGAACARQFAAAGYCVVIGDVLDTKVASLRLNWWRPG